MQNKVTSADKREPSSFPCDKIINASATRHRCGRQPCSCVRCLPPSNVVEWTRTLTFTTVPTSWSWFRNVLCIRKKTCWMLLTQMPPKSFFWELLPDYVQHCCNLYTWTTSRARRITWVGRPIRQLSAAPIACRSHLPPQNDRKSTSNDEYIVGRLVRRRSPCVRLIFRSTQSAGSAVCQTESVIWL